MKKLYLILLLCLCVSVQSFSQTIVISGQCITGNITATQAGTEAGRPYYTGTGTILGFPSTQLAIYWIGAPDNVWVIAFDGQPFYQNPCNTNIPPGTTPNVCAWSFISGNPACTGTPLSVTGAVIVPVTLTSFTATPSAGNVLLHWSTSQESNNRGFTVERSADGQTWTDLGFVAGAGTTASVSNYNYTDALPGNGTNFYRLRQQDMDGRVTYSDIATASISSNRFFTISDNPGKGLYKLSMQPGQGMVELDVTDAAGKSILRQKTNLANPVIDISRQAPGMYWLRIKTNNNQSTIKLVKL